MSSTALREPRRSTAAASAATLAKAAERQATDAARREARAASEVARREARAASERAAAEEAAAEAQNSFMPDGCSLCFTCTGSMVSCACERAFHLSCTGLSEVPTNEWRCAFCDTSTCCSERCEFGEDAGHDTIMCDDCHRSFHVTCTDHQARDGPDWKCEVCRTLPRERPSEAALLRSAELIAAAARPWFAEMAFLRWVPECDYFIASQRLRRAAADARALADGERQLTREDAERLLDDWFLDMVVANTPDSLPIDEDLIAKLELIETPSLPTAPTAPIVPGEQIVDDGEPCVSNEPIATGSLEFAPGALVMARYRASQFGKERTKWFPGTVGAVDVDGRCYRIVFDDGDTEDGVLPEFVRARPAVSIWRARASYYDGQRQIQLPLPMQYVEAVFEKAFISRCKEAARDRARGALPRGCSVMGCYVIEAPSSSRATRSSTRSSRETGSSSTMRGGERLRIGEGRGGGELVTVELDAPAVRMQGANDHFCLAYSLSSALTAAGDAEAGAQIADLAQALYELPREADQIARLRESCSTLRRWQVRPLKNPHDRLHDRHTLVHALLADPPGTVAVFFFSDSAHSTSHALATYVASAGVAWLFDANKPTALRLSPEALDCCCLLPGLKFAWMRNGFRLQQRAVPCGGGKWVEQKRELRKKRERVV